MRRWLRPLGPPRSPCLQQGARRIGVDGSCRARAPGLWAGGLGKPGQERQARTLEDPKPLSLRASKSLNTTQLLAYLPLLAFNEKLKDLPREKKKQNQKKTELIFVCAPCFQWFFRELLTQGWIGGPGRRAGNHLSVSPHCLTMTEWAFLPPEGFPELPRSTLLSYTLLPLGHWLQLHISLSGGLLLVSFIGL